MSSVEVDGVLGLHDPTGGAELRVDGVAGDLVGVLVGVLVGQRAHGIKGAGWSWMLAQN